MADFVIIVAGFEFVESIVIESKVLAESTTSDFREASRAMD